MPVDYGLYTAVSACNDSGVRLLFALAGLHRVNRGAETAFVSLATELAHMGHEITLIGSGPHLPNRAYRFLRASCIGRETFEHFPKLPMLRSDTAWEELTFALMLLRRYRPMSYDATVTCGFPFTNLVLRRPTLGIARPAHIFVTQNGDWPAFSNDAEFRLFGCDGLVCTNPDFFDRNKRRYPSALIPNGVDLALFAPGQAVREKFGLPARGPVILMVSALIASKHVDIAIDAVSQIKDATLVVAGDGPLRRELQSLAEARMAGRYHQLRVDPNDMPDLYRSADVFLHLSRDESFGNVFIEALAVGTPIVAYDLPRTRWIVGDCAFLAQSNDSSELVEQIELASRTGASRREQSATQARKFSWGEVASKYAAFLEQVIVTKARS